MSDTIDLANAIRGDIRQCVATNAAKLVRQRVFISIFTLPSVRHYLGATPSLWAIARIKQIVHQDVCHHDPEFPHHRYMGAALPQAGIPWDYTLANPTGSGVVVVHARP